MCSSRIKVFKQIRDCFDISAVTIITKGQMTKIRGSICNIAVDVQDICNPLPRNSQSFGIILVELKTAFKGYVYFQPV